MTTKKDFVDWCFNNLDGTEDKYDLGHAIWKYWAEENDRLLRKLCRLERLVAEFKLSIEPPTPTKKRKK